MNGTDLIWQACDFSNGNIEYNQFAIRFKTNDTATAFIQSIKDVLFQYNLNSVQ